MEEWKEYKIGEIAQTNVAQYSLSENWAIIQYLDTGSITKNQISNINLYSGNPDLPSRARRKVKDGDIVFSAVRPNLCHYGYMDNPPSNLLVSTGFVVISVNTKVADSRFLYYYLTQNKIVNHLHAIGEQAVSTYPTIRPADIEELSVFLPPLSEQKRISSILYSLDSKIGCNSRINDNLQQQAQALFKSWFVDFEPFKDGEFVESELGMIPKGWRVGTIDNIVDISKKSINPNKYPEVQFVHYSIPSYDNGKQPEKQFGREILSNKFVVKDKMTLLSKLNPRIKRVWFVNDVVDNSICSTEFVPYMAHDVVLSAFVYCLISSQGFYDFVMSLVNGATGSHQRFHPEETLSYRLAFNKELAMRFSRLVEPMIAQIIKNQQETHRLAELRDTLLPRLMSGKLTVNIL